MSDFKDAPLVLLLSMASTFIFLKKKPKQIKTKQIVHYEAGQTLIYLRFLERCQVHLHTVLSKRWIGWLTLTSAWSTPVHTEYDQCFSKHPWGRVRKSCDRHLENLIVDSLAKKEKM